MSTWNGQTLRIVIDFIKCIFLLFYFPKSLAYLSSSFRFRLYVQALDRQKEKEEVKMGRVDTPVIMALGRLRQGDCPENQASLGYSETISQKT